MPRRSRSPVDPALLADARALRGHACASGEDVPRDAGYLPVAGRAAGGLRTAASCLSDVGSAPTSPSCSTPVATPAAWWTWWRCRTRGQVSDLLQCVVPADDGSSTPLSVGVGLRRPGQKAPIAYWEVDVAHGQFIRQPLGVLAWSDRVRCQEPEVGD